MRNSLDSFTLTPMLLGVFILSIQQPILNDNTNSFKPLLSLSFVNDLQAIGAIDNPNGKLPHISYKFINNHINLSHSSRYEDNLLILCHLDRLAYQYFLVEGDNNYNKNISIPYISLYPNSITFLLFYTIIKQVYINYYY